uniref:MULE domain-containing protein n=1 Tax=Heterorhabditis bacteriophora TaxID=37862 RepID=A0A1I7XKU3_HETBA
MGQALTLLYEVAMPYQFQIIVDSYVRQAIKTNTDTSKHMIKLNLAVESNVLMVKYTTCVVAQKQSAMV